jgi:hypothetical protein
MPAAMAAHTSRVRVAILVTGVTYEWRTLELMAHEVAAALRT